MPFLANFFGGRAEMGKPSLYFFNWKIAKSNIIAESDAITHPVINFRKENDKYKLN
jgi:hypothetical protein